MADYERYSASGEVNSTVADARAKIAEIKERYGARAGVTTDELDGLTVALPDGSWFNLRPSNTEPLLRLNVEAARRRDDGRAARRGPRGRPRLTIRTPTRAAADGRTVVGRVPTDVPLAAPRAAGPVGPAVARAADGARWQHRTSTGAAGIAAAHEGGRPWPSRSTPG